MDTITLQSLADILAIQNLLGRFDLAANNGDAAAFAATWVPDGVWEIGEPHLLRAVGVAAIVEAFRQFGAYNKSFFRLTGQAAITVQGDKATVESPTIETAQRSVGGYHNLATYHDRLVRDSAGNWRFAHRRYEYLLIDDQTPITGIARAPGH